MTPNAIARIVTDESLKQIEEVLSGETGPDECAAHEWMTGMIAEIRRLREEWHTALEDYSAELVAEAVAKEREACAIAAERCPDCDGDPQGTSCMVPHRIAARIRSRKDATKSGIGPETIPVWRDITPKPRKDN